MALRIFRLFEYQFHCFRGCLGELKFDISLSLLKVEWFQKKKDRNAKFAHKRYKNVIYILKALEAVQQYTLLEQAKNRNLYLKKKLAV